jgi:hypothetical protein
MKILITQKKKKTKTKKIQRRDMKDKRDRQQPKEQYKDNNNDQTDRDSSDEDSEDEDRQIIFPTKKDLEKQYFFPRPISYQEGKTETKTEIEIKEEDGEEPIRREEGQDDAWIANKIKKSVEKCI